MRMKTFGAVVFLAIRALAIPEEGTAQTSNLADSRAGVQSNPALAAAAARPTPAAAAAGITPGAPQRGQPAQPVTLLKVAPPKITSVDPEYPAVALGAHLQGSVVLELTIATDGRVIEARVVKGVPLLDAAALAAVTKWVYDGRGMTGPVKTTVTVPFALVLSRDVSALRAAAGKDTWVVGPVVRLEQLNSGWNLHLAAAETVFVHLPAGPDLDELIRAERRGDSVVRKTIAFKGRPRDIERSIRLDLSQTVNAIKVLSDILR